MFNRKPKITSWIYRSVSIVMVFTLLWPACINAQLMPQVFPGNIIIASRPVTPVLLKGIHLDPENPLQFQFIIDAGDADLGVGNARERSLREEASKLIHYFFAALTVPDDDLWVNLSPYEKQRIIPKAFGNTELGRDLLTQDYILKRRMAALLYPEGEFGKQFWNKIYKKAHQIYGTTEIPLDTYNKVWIIPDKAVVYNKNNLVYAIENHFKVMLEEDYVALSQRQVGATSRALKRDDEVRGITTKESSDMQLKPLISKIGTRGDFNSPEFTKIIREIIIPAIETEVNEGEHFAVLRQIGFSMMLGAWYKMNLREGILAHRYVDQNKIKGVDIAEKEAAEKIYNQYIDIFKRGVFDYVKEEYDPYTHMTVARKYFSGGARFDYRSVLTVTADVDRLDSAVGSGSNGLYRVDVVSSPLGNDSQKPWRFSDLRSIYHDPDKREYGDKTVLLAQFLHYLEENNITFGSRKPADLIPELFVISLTQASNLALKEKFSSVEQQGLRDSLDVIGRNQNLKYGDPNRPLIVSARTAPDEITPGMFLSILNIGINDQTVEGLADLFIEHDVTPENARTTAYSLYAKLIEDFLAEIPNQAGEKYPRGKLRQKLDSSQFLQRSGFDSLKEIEADPEKKVQALKILYRKHFQEEFPQDVYRQLHRVVKAIPAVSHYAFDAGVERPHPILIQRMVFGTMMSDHFSGAGELTSRNPLNGEKQLSGNLEEGKQGDMTTGIIKVLDQNALDQLNLKAEQFYKRLLDQGEHYLGAPARVEITVENGVPYLLQIRRMEKSDEVDVKVLWDLLTLWRSDEARGIPEEKRRGLSPEQVFEKAKPYLKDSFLRKRERLEDASGLILLGKGITVSKGAASARMVMSARGASQFVESAEGQNSNFILFQREIRADAKPALEHEQSRGAVAFDQVGAHVESLTRTYNIPGLVGIELGSQFEDVFFDYKERKIIFKSKSGEDVEVREGLDDISIGEDGTIYKGQTNVISENKPEGMSKEAALLTIFLLEHEGREAVIEVQSNGWLAKRSDIWTADKFRKKLDEINNPEYTAYGKEGPLYGPIINVMDKRDATVEEPGPKVAEEIEYRDISDDIINRAAEHVVRIAHTEALNSFIYWMWYYYDKLDYVDYAHREEQFGEKAFWVPSNIKYRNFDEARLKYFLSVLKGAEDVLARSIFYWVDRHKTAAFTFKKGIFPALEENQAKSLFQKMVKYGIQEGSYRSVDYTLIRILAELIMESKKNRLSITPVDLIKSLEPVNIERRRRDDPKEFETVSVSAEAQRGWLLAGLYAFYFERRLPQRTRDASLPTVDEINQLLQELVAGHERDFQINQDTINMSVSDILDRFAHGEEETAASPVSRNDLGGIDLRSYDRLLTDYSGAFNAASLETGIHRNVEFNGILPVINGITPITSLQFFYSN